MRSDYGCRRWLLVLLALPRLAAADAYEVGVGVSTLQFPAYRGSSQGASYLLPVPYLVVRSDHLSVDRGGVRGLLMDGRWATLDLSLNAAVPVRSDDVPERIDMPNLDPVVEVGPSLELHLSDPDAPVRWQFKLPLRGVFSFGPEGLGHVGWSFHPRLAVDLTAPGGWNLSGSLGPLFADRRFHNYYYGVAPAYALPDRPAYDAEPGYSGTSAMLTVSRRFGRYWLGGFVRYDDLSGAAFLDSPLVTSDESWMGGFALAWVFRSKNWDAAAARN